MVPVDTNHKTMMKTTIEVWTIEDLQGIAELDIQQVWTEVSDTGDVLREIGIGRSGDVVYTVPSNHKRLGRGLFDNQKVILKSESEEDPSLRRRFESLWESSA